MSVSSPTSAVRYVGNGSTATAYVIPFPFLSTAHIYAAVSSDGVEALELLTSGDFAVTRLADGSGGTLTTTAAVSSPAEIVIFRTVPLTQPTEFQLQGPFPAVSAETALDRCLMQVQQLNRRLNALEDVTDEDYIFVPGGNPSTSISVKIWEDATERATITPVAAGQLGVETDTQTIWIGQSVSVGDWEQFGERRTNKVVLGFTADAGNPGANQTAIADVFEAWNVDAAIFGGDNAYNAVSGYGGGYSNDWLAFAALITAGKAYPALGNHDLDSTTWEEDHADLFPYLPGNGRYYNVELGNGMVELFVLNSGIDTIADLIEEDGNTEGSTQHAWFVAAVEASRARWKIAVFHHPPVSLGSGVGRTLDDMAWPELERMDLILCGHSHINEILKWSDTMIVNVSHSVQTAGEIGGVVLGTGTETSWPLWADNENRGVGRIVATQDRLSVEVWNLSGSLLEARSHDDLQPRPISRETFRAVAALDDVETSSAYLVTTLSDAGMIRGVMLAGGGSPTGDYTWIIYADIDGDSFTVASGDWLDASRTALAATDDPNRYWPRGTVLTIVFAGAVGAITTGLEVTLFTQRNK